MIYGVRMERKLFMGVFAAAVVICSKAMVSTVKT